jgi:3-hydroxymyristoyl/3-hydroxydecanoyl-(acyl carrier protein) dehydratase
MADPPLTFEEILELLPHRYPMLLIDPPTGRSCRGC